MTETFLVEVPPDSEGAVLKVEAPDGVVLKIPLPDGVVGGDKLRMSKGDDGRWGCAGVSRDPSPPTPAQACSAGCRRSSEQLAAELASPEALTVQLQTTKGPILIKVVPSWALMGAERFLSLVDDGFYHEVPVYRCVEGFLAQFGLVKDTSRTERYPMLPDDDLAGVPIEEGTVIFAARGANTRTTQLCLFLGDYPQLGESPWETPIGKVCPESMATLRALCTDYGDMPQQGGTGPDPLKFEELGNDYLKANFPDLDYIIGAARVLRRVNTEWIECQDIQGVYYYSQRTHEALQDNEVSPEALAAGQVQALVQQAPQTAVVKFQFGEWAVIAGEQGRGDLFVHLPSGQHYLQPPPQFLQAQEEHLRMQQAQAAAQHPQQLFASPNGHPQQQWLQRPPQVTAQPPNMLQLPRPLAPPASLQQLQLQPLQQQLPQQQVQQQLQQQQLRPQQLQPKLSQLQPLQHVGPPTGMQLPRPMLPFQQAQHVSAPPWQLGQGSHSFVPPMQAGAPPMVPVRPLHSCTGQQYGAQLLVAP